MSFDNEFGPKRMVGRTVHPRQRPGRLNDPQFDEFFREAQQMQKAMLKSVPWYMRLGVVLSLILSAAISIGVVVLIVLAIMRLAG